jgi:lambda repressor-like predicted transcriptional regulator
MTASTNSHDERLGPIRQRQKRLTEAQVGDMAARYHEGATVYELAAEFCCSRATIAQRLKKAGFTMRLLSPSPELVDEMTLLYESGLSLVSVAEHVGYCASTVQNYLRNRSVKTRDTHGRIHKICGGVSALS